MPYKPTTTPFLGSEVMLSLRCQNCKQYPAVHNQATGNCPGEVRVHVCGNNCLHDPFAGKPERKLLMDPTGIMSGLVCFGCQQPMQVKNMTPAEIAEWLTNAPKVPDSRQ